MTTLFLSYKSENRPVALRVRDAMREWGYETWIDCFDLHKGGYWPNQIEAALTRCDAVIGLMTPLAVKSNNVKDEWHWALDNGKPLLIVRIEKAVAPLRVHSLDHIDCERDFDAGMQTLKRVLQERSFVQPSPSPEAEVATKTPLQLRRARSSNRQQVLKKVEAFWIEGYLREALSGSDLNPLPRLEPDSLLKHFEYEDFNITPEMSPAEIFKNLNSELLILGEPGSGKTIFMLKLARYLIEQAFSDERKPIPIVLNLSSWGTDHLPLKDWLEARLNAEYQVPRKVTRDWLNNEKLLLLLDGLDEVREEYQDDCVEAINSFREDNDAIKLVVCSRIADYEKLIPTNRLNVRASILMQPLTDAQIAGYLAGTELASLRALLKTDPGVVELARIPFMLNIMAQAYSDAAPQELVLPADAPVSARRQDIFRVYTSQRLQSQRDYPRPLSVKAMRHYLRCLAEGLNQRKLSIFYLESIQRDSLNDPRLRSLYRWGGLPLSLFLGVVFGILSGYIVGGVTGYLSGHLPFGLWAGPNLGLWLGLGTGVAHAIMHLRDSSVRGAEKMEFKFSLERALLGASGAVLITCIGFVAGPAGAWAVGWPGGVICMFATGLRASPNVGLRATPNQGIRRAARNLRNFALLSTVYLGGVGWLIFGLMGGLQVNPLAGLVLAMLAGAMIGLSFGFTFGGGEVLLRHLALRIFLTVEQTAPWRYQRFLEEAKKRGLLRSVGGGYIFIHRDLLEYFADIQPK